MAARNKVDGPVGRPDRLTGSRDVYSHSAACNPRRLAKSVRKKVQQDRYSDRTQCIRRRNQMQCDLAMRPARKGCFKPSVLQITPDEKLRLQRYPRTREKERCKNICIISPNRAWHSDAHLAMLFVPKAPDLTGCTIIVAQAHVILKIPRMLRPPEPREIRGGADEQNPYRAKPPRQEGRIGQRCNP
jgi:hypothetical protein